MFGIKRIRFAILQWVLLTPFLAFLNVAVEDRLKPELVEGTKIGINVFTVASTVLCMYHVNVLRAVSQDIGSLATHHVEQTASSRPTATVLDEAQSSAPMQSDTSSFECIWKHFAGRYM